MADFATTVRTWLNGRLVGRDTNGNRYYEARRPTKGQRSRRWVVFANGGNEPSSVPAEWHAWLAYTSDKPLTDVQRHAWQQPHDENRTGTKAAYLPPGHDFRGGNRERAAGDYEAWKP